MAAIGLHLDLVDIDLGSLDVQFLRDVCVDSKCLWHVQLRRFDAASSSRRSSRCPAGASTRAWRSCCPCSSCSMRPNTNSDRINFAPRVEQEHDANVGFEKLHPCIICNNNALTALSCRVLSSGRIRKLVGLRTSPKTLLWKFASTQLEVSLSWL